MAVAVVRVCVIEMSVVGELWMRLLVILWINGQSTRKEGELLCACSSEMALHRERNGIRMVG